MVNYYKKRVFIGSSTKSRENAEDIARILEELGCSTIRWWDPSVFVGGQYTFESILKVANEVDAGLFLLDEDDIISEKNFTAVNVNVVLEAGVFYGVLGQRGVGLCTIGSPKIPSDWDGITRIPFSREALSTFTIRLRKWLENVNRVKHKEPNNVHMGNREKIHRLYPVGERMGFNKNEYGDVDIAVSKHITRMRILNICSNLIINPDYAEHSHTIPDDPNSISKVIRSILTNTRAQMTLILAKPTENVLKDMQHKIANPNPNKATGAIYSAQSELYNALSGDTLFAEAKRENRFGYYVTDMCMPFAIFAVEYDTEYSFLNHVKVDLYSAPLTNENERRSMIIWQNSDEENYNFFLRNFDNVRTQLCSPHNMDEMRIWADKWKTMEKQV
jgi:hypothetical protein